MRSFILRHTEGYFLGRLFDRSLHGDSDAALDLAKLNLDASIGFENPAPKGLNARPSVTIGWRGPLTDPVRRLDIAPLMAVISLRTMDNEMRRIDGRDRATSISSPIPTLATETPTVPKVSPPAPRPKPQLAPVPPVGRQPQINPSQ